MVQDSAPPASELQLRFDALQAKLVDQWRLIGGFNDLEQTMVVVPSISLEIDVPGTVLQSYEERMLFLLLLLRKPRARIVYVTSMPILDQVVDYYLGLLPGVIRSHALPRLHRVAVLDATSRPLTRKILERPRLIEELRRLVPDPETAHLVPFNTTELERDLSLELGIPMYGADPRFFSWGTKSGGRCLFEEEGVVHPAGVEGLESRGELVAAVCRIRREHPGVSQLLVKLDEAVSGEGNAVLDLGGLPPPGAEDEPGAVEARLGDLRFELEGETTERFLSKLERHGGVVEERIMGEELRSPSVQLRITPLGEVQLLSSHDQLLGGPSGQSYLGCVFPADPCYAAVITREAAKVGERLRDEGVLGRLAVDFVVTRTEAGDWRPYAIEINLRKGGTTTPYLTLEFLTQGSYDPESATFTAPSGRQKHYVSSDHVESDHYRALTPDDLFDLVVRHRLHFDQTTQTGIVFHMLSAVTEQGRFGLTAVADSREAAHDLYRRTLEILDRESEAAARGG